MSALAQVNEPSGNSIRVFSKGAPEVLKNYMKDVPADYDKIYLDYVKNGGRVLALGYKHVQKMSMTDMLAYTREEAESDLIFAGFIIAECPLKPDTGDVI